jgi:hypothetical protein
VVTSQGVDFVPLTQRSFGVDNPTTLAQFRAGTGMSNALPVIGPIVISEILYHPPGGTNGSDEFIELRNTTADSVPLYDPAFPTNQWKLDGGVSFTFPPGVNLAAGAHLLVVDFDPTNLTALNTFRTRYGISASVPVFGPFTGSLGNDEDTVALYRPDSPQPPTAPDAGFVPYVIADRVSYTDDLPWPIGAVDGGGLSLQRIAPQLYGNEPLNWIEALPTPGADNSTASPDTDGDGIPDWAEDLMGLNRNDPADAALDPDGDGLTNLQEFLAGTDHLDSTSALKFEVITIGSDVTLIFQAVANKSYSVLYKNSLADVNWMKLADVEVSPITEMVELPDSPDGSTRFYRLVTPALEP